MKTLEEPPYLTVGTDVSAKYRGAFCEAKIKTAKRLVKAKVTFKPDLSTAEVQDEHIRGPLKVGAAVEVKNQDGVYQEATITKLTDASIYTVVFDDGDEKTLRRSSLCLKGARHFAESETLDRLPLTNPEHFGTPVIGKKGNRGRRSNPVQEEESSSSSSEEEEGDQKQNEDLFGKVVCVEAVVTGDKKKTTWYPALVISPDCHDDVTMKKDNIFVRSFKDGKFYTVLRKDVREVDGRSPPRADAVLKPALDAALEFQRQASVPAAWRTEVKDESSSSEEDNEDEDEDEEEASSEEEEEEVEPYPEEKENFLQQLYKFMEDRGTPINKKPVLGYRNLNLFKLYRLVHKLGGFDSIESGSVWKSVYQDLGIPVLNSAAGYNVKCAYRKYLYGFEEYSTSTSITFRMDLPLKQGPKGEAKVEAGGPAGAMGPPATSSTEEKTSPEGVPSPSAASVSKEEKPEAGRNKMGPDPPKAELKAGGEEEEEEDGGAQKREADKGLSVCRLGAEGEEQEEQEEEPAGRVVSRDVSSQEGEEGEEVECYPPGMKVQVRYGRNLKTYEATVREAGVEGGQVLYLVHYCGWNMRYDEWVKADKIVRPANKNVPKVKHRKKIKNKAERERDRQERLSEREDLGSSPNNRAPRPPKPGSAQEGFSKMEEASESSTDEDDREDEEGDRDDEDRPGGRRGLRRGGPPDPPHGAERWDGGPPLEGSKPPPTVTGKIQEPISSESPETGKRRGQSEFEVEVSPRKRRSEGAAERSTKGPSKAKTRSTRSADWHLAGGPRRAEDRGERGPCPGEERAPSSSCSSEDEGLQTPEAPTGDGERSRPKPRGSPSKKYNGIKEKPRGGRPSGFWDIPEKRAKMAAGGVEERPAGRSKGQKDVWSSIQAQWPKKTLKELFSDSDTEAANSPPPAVSASGLEEARGEREGGPGALGDEALEEQNDKLQEFPSSGSNSVLNTPPTTPESPSMEGPGRPPSPPPSTAPVPAPAPSPPPAPLPPAPLQEEVAGGRSETDSSTVEVESLGGESQDPPHADGTASPSKAFDGSLSCNSSSTCSLELSGSSQQDSEQKAKVSASQKRHKELQASGAAKKHKPNRKSLGVPPKKNRKTAHHSSDSEDQSVGEGTVGEGTAKSPASKTSTTDMKAAISPKCPGRTPPSSHKYHKHGDDHSHHREHQGRTPRLYKWSFQMSDLEKMSSLERISFLQEKLQDIRNHYLSLKSEVASIDRRRKRMKKKERESTVAASSSSSSSSSPSSSSLTAAVMLTLAEPPVSSSSSQNSGVSVECR
ncbi:AT-rich interactive domain-containing protein 4B isoform X1 [Osmerus eperlanus]|uniref:AT-rich interactive domain-containing protein 4B isoform X1 n=1 Tax=Osmerus eperlanus TaxID=29151 RepID=UPI002E12C0FD